MNSEKMGRPPKNQELIETFSRNFKKIYEEGVWNVDDFVVELGVSKTAIYNWLNGHVLPSPRNMRKLAEFLKVHRSVLLK